MNQKQIIVGLAGVIIGLILSPILMPYARLGGGPMMGRSTAQGSMMQGGMMEGGMMAPSRDMDRHFIVRMIPHHEDAIEMAEDAVSKAEHQELKSLARDIISAQQSEIDTMREWYAKWYGEEPGEIGASMEMMMHMGVQGPMLRRAGTAEAYSFDLDFIDAMIPHHQMAVMMAQMLLVSTAREEMQKLAEDIITAQSKEIEAMRAWRSAWAKY